MIKFKSENYLINERLRWLVKLRWVAALGVVAAVYVSSEIIRIPLPVAPIYTVALILFSYNIFFTFLAFRKIRETPDDSAFSNILANVQIFLDLLCLAILIHFSGGVENPFIFYFIFHVIIAGILLSRRAAFLQTTYAIFLFLLIIIFEYKGILPHYPLRGVVPDLLHREIFYLYGISVVFISTLYISGYMASSISKRLKERELNLIEANKLLKEKDQIKSKYVLRVTHDIKEDLSAIQGCIDPVTDGITGDLNEKQMNLLQRAKRRSQKLIFFVNALLNITKMKLTQELRKDYFSFPELIQEVTENIIPRAKPRNITFTVNLDPGVGQIKGVRIYIQESILNMLANALKYTHDGGGVSLKVSDKKDRLLIEIKDSGIGIPKNELSHVFEEFYRAENARKLQRQGTGLGLSMARQTAKMHGGKIWVESNEGEGSTFYLELPKEI